MKNNSKFIASIKKCYSSVKLSLGKFFSHFAGFNTLVAMQLKDKLNMSFKSDKKGALTKVILYFVLIAGITAIITVGIKILTALGVFGLGGILPISTFNVFFYFIMILNIISCIIRLTNSLYFSPDNQVLLTYPVKGGQIFLSKLVVFFVLELVKNFTFLVPLFLAYAISFGFPIYFYFWLLFCFLILAILPVAIGSVLSIPAMYIKSFFKKYQYIETAILLILLIGITVGVFYVVNLLPEDLKIATMWNTDYFPAITNFTRALETYLLPLVFLSGLIMGYEPSGVNNPQYLQILNEKTVPILFSVIGICLILFVIAYFIAQPLFVKMASKPFEYKKNAIKHTFKASEKDLFEDAKFFVLIQNERPKDKSFKHDLVKALKRIYKFSKKELNSIDSEQKLINLLSKFEKNMKFVLCTKEEFVESKCGLIFKKDSSAHLVFVNSKGLFKYKCYEPEHLSKKNSVSNPYLSGLVKDLLTDFRSAGNILNNYLLFITAPLALLVLDSIFNSMRTSFDGKTYIILFNTLIISMIPLASNVTMASIYSREGASSYMLKYAPINYIASLSSKLIIRAIIVTASIAFSTVVFVWKTDISYINPVLLFFAVWSLYIGHLIWSAELDFMNPMEKLYITSGEGAVSNPNETTSAILTFLISGVFAGLSYFFIFDDVLSGFIKVFLVCVAFLIVRILMFVLRIIGYGTSRSEGRDN